MAPAARNRILGGTLAALSSAGGEQRRLAALDECEASRLRSPGSVHLWESVLPQRP